MTRRSLPIPEGLDGERIDAALSRLLGLSRTKAADLLADGAVQLDGCAVSKSTRVRSGAWLDVQIKVDEPPSAPLNAPVPGMEIVYEDDDLVIVDKPVGVAAHPSPGWTGPTVVGALRAKGYRVSTSGASERQGIVHRLDVGTSGLMAVAKSERAYTGLKRQFRNRSVEKVYHTVVQGHPEPLLGTIDAPIGRHPRADYRFAVREDGKHSVTHYEVIEMLRSASLVEVHLETGRTHQIRVHFSALKHPCVADLTYGADPTLAMRVGLARQWLHAVQLAFEHPVSGKWVDVTSQYPPDLAHALRVLQGES